MASAIANHRAAEDHLDRVQQAHQRINDQLFEQLQPAVTQARRALTGAHAREPQRLVDTLLDEPGADNGAAGVTDAQHALADAEKAVNEARRVRSLLEQEIQHSEAETKLALHELDKAVAAVVSTDPARASVLSEFNGSARRALRCAQILRTAGLTVQGAGARAALCHKRCRRADGRAGVRKGPGLAGGPGRTARGRGSPVAGIAVRRRRSRRRIIQSPELTMTPAPPDDPAFKISQLP